MTVTIKLTKGFEAEVDDIDADLASVKWYVCNRYAARATYPNGKRVTQYMHRVIMERMLGRPLQKGEICDHINNDNRDNRRSNLRIATPSQSIQNTRQRFNSEGKLKGAHRMSGCETWLTHIMVDGKYVQVGRFKTPLEAHRAYCEAALKHYGEFANFGTNSPFTPADFT